MTEIKLTKRYPNSRTEDIVDAYMRGWNDALDAVQNGKFHINEAEQTENSSEKPNNCEVKNYCDDCLYTDTCDSKEFFYACTSKATISKMEQVDKDINVRSKDEPQTCSVSGRPYTDCSRCEYFRCTADEPQTELKGSKRLVKGSDPCDGCIFDGHENVFACVACVLKDKQSGKE